MNLFASVLSAKSIASSDASRMAVYPLSLVMFDHQFYVLARRSDATFYCYRFARMGDVEATTEVFTYPTKSEFDPRNVFGPVLGVHISGMGPVEDVEVELTGDWARYAKTHKWHHSQRVVPADAGVIVQMQVRHCPELETWALGFGEHATVTKPQILREKVAARLTKAVANYPMASSARPPVAKARSRTRTPTRKVGAK
jgi:predicted DNA-binding transcriptional regulator YafY